MIQRLLVTLLLSVSAAVGAAEHVTAGNAALGHPEFVFNVDEPDLAVWLTNGVEQMVRTGSRFKPDENLVIGSAVLKIQDNGDGRLRLLEPDFRSFPWKLVDSVSGSIKLTLRQTLSLQSVLPKAEPAFARIDRPLLVVGDALSAPAVRMERVGGRETGWILRNALSEPSSNESASAQAMSVYEAILRRPEIADFFAFPPDQGIVILVRSRDRFLVLKDGKKLQPAAGSYLARRQSAS